ncbi:MAG: OmpA family protein [Rubrivivax sp.]|nr:MAG: OmpA family protein [Rubrivivax sp.]
MRTATLLSPFLTSLALLTSCSSPPKPPSVDEANRRPVNSAMAVELQVCENDLQNTRLLATESTRLADATSATLASIAARQQALADLKAPDPPAAQGNALFTVRFGYGSARVDIPTDAEKALIAQARSAPLIMLRGRTDGPTESLAESRIARERANAVRDYLVAAGIDASRIRATYQPLGDHVADNASPSGQALNRRVEIELYRALPVALGHGQ